MLLIVVATLVLIGLRLVGNTSVAYQAVAHVFVGSMGTWAWLTHELAGILSFVLLCVTELYMVLVKFFPGLSIVSLFKPSTGVPPVKK